MTAPEDPTAILAQINAARDQTYQNIALTQGILTQANQAAAAAAQDRAAVLAMVQQAVTVDMTVGTRVFAGDQMIFGDTGWRNVADSLLATDTFALADAAPFFRLMRAANEVILAFRVKVVPSPAGAFLTQTLPLGFRPAIEASYIHYGFAQIGSVLTAIGNTNTQNRVSVATNPASQVGNTLYGLARWPTKDPWPTSLPGTAA